MIGAAGVPFRGRRFYEAALWGRSGGCRELGARGRRALQGPEFQDDFNKVATDESAHSIPFYGRDQAGIATPPQTAAAFLSFDMAAGNGRELTDLLRMLTERRPAR